jgi:ribosome biogenesis protein BRX1
MNDLAALLPHSKKDAKLDTKSQLFHLNELADLYNCNNVLFFESRKRGQDLYLWLSKAPNGPSMKLHLQNLHTADELNLSGNCLKGSRPILSFDKSFDSTPSSRLTKELLTHIFGVPPKSRKQKPFIDHVVSFSLLDSKIWFRNYQIVEKEGGGNDMELVEIGPRFVLTPILIFEGSFSGPVIYENREFVSPNVVRAMRKKAASGRYAGRKEAERERDVRGKLGWKSKRPKELGEATLFA